jgi:hypothetical protein
VNVLVGTAPRDRQTRRRPPPQLRGLPRDRQIVRLRYRPILRRAAHAPQSGQRLCIDPLNLDDAELVPNTKQHRRSIRRTISGFGTVADGLEPLKQHTAGAAKAAGTLRITGALQLTDTTTTTLHLESAASFGRIRAGGRVFLAGKATLTGGYLPAAGDRLETSVVAATQR